MRKKTRKPNRMWFVMLLMFCMVATTAFTAVNMYGIEEDDITPERNIVAEAPIETTDTPNIAPIRAQTLGFYTGVDINDHIEYLMKNHPISDSDYVDDEIINEEESIEDENTEVIEPVEEEKEPEITLPETTTEGQIIHTIKTGDNYWEIAKKYYGMGNYCYAIAEYNGITTNTILHNGDTLIIPSLDDPYFQMLISGIVYDAYPDKEVIENTYSDSYSNGKRMRPTVDIDIPEPGESMKNYTGEVDTSNFTYWGACKITGYTPGCAHCCGGSTAGLGSSGVACIPGYTVAMGTALPFGTTIYVEGYGFYVVEDRGVGNYHVDISAPSHDACYGLTASGVNVWIVE